MFFSKGITGSWLTCCDLVRDAAQIQAVPGTSEIMSRIQQFKIEEKTLHATTQRHQSSFNDSYGNEGVIYNNDSHLVTASECPHPCMSHPFGLFYSPDVSLISFLTCLRAAEALSRGQRALHITQD